MVAARRRCIRYLTNLLVVAFRSYITLLLLLNYLLVVGAGLVERPARAVDRPFAYAHSHDCQLRNAMRVGCFDDCNGVQYVVKKHGERLPLQQLLTTFKGLDAHCLPEAPAVLVAPVFRSVQSPSIAREAGVAVGHRGQVELPPRRG